MITDKGTTYASWCRFVVCKMRHRLLTKEEACGVIDRARENSETKHSSAWERVKLVRGGDGGGGGGGAVAAKEKGI